LREVNVMSCAEAACVAPRATSAHRMLERIERGERSGRRDERVMAMVLVRC
jgi:hypothetical protein